VRPALSGWGRRQGHYQCAGLAARGLADPDRRCRCGHRSPWPERRSTQCQQRANHHDPATTSHL